jgi:gas vesicle protein
MMNVATGQIGNVLVQTTQQRGATPEELAERAVNKILHIADSAPPELAAQAAAFKQQIYQVLLSYLKEAVNSHNVTLVSRFKDAGCPELIKLLDE